MSIECRCDECNKEIDNGEDTICFKCYKSALDNIESLKEEIKNLENRIEEMRDE
jgi:hypothetical protein